MCGFMWFFWTRCYLDKQMGWDFDADALHTVEKSKPVWQPPQEKQLTNTQKQWTPPHTVGLQYLMFK